MFKTPLALILALGLGACVSIPEGLPPAQRPTVATRPPPQQPAAPAPSSQGFIAPRIMEAPGIEHIIGQSAAALTGLFGTPRLQVREGDAIKLQFSGTPCVLDVFLYPLRPGVQPSATHVEARRASDGADVDRAACAKALRR